MDYEKTKEKNLSFLCTINLLLSYWFFPLCNTNPSGYIKRTFLPFEILILYLLRPIQPEHFKPNLIWYDSAFKHRISRPDHIFFQKSHVTVSQVLNMDYEKTKEKNLSFLCTINHLLSYWFFPLCNTNPSGYIKRTFLPFEILILTKAYPTRAL
jgi:hypothetical protein